LGGAGRPAGQARLDRAGEKDPPFGPDKLARWQEALPNSETQTYPDAGRFVAEERGVRLVEVVRAFLSRTGGAASARSDK